VALVWAQTAIGGSASGSGSVSGTLVPVFVLRGYVLTGMQAYQGLRGLSSKTGLTGRQNRITLIGSF
jgi:hypothetical protein